MKLRSEALTVAKYRNHTTKLGVAEVRGIRWLWLNRGALQSSSVEEWRLSQDDIGELFEVGQDHVSRIVKRDQWADLPRVLSQDEVPEILREMELPRWLVQAIEDLVDDRSQESEEIGQMEIAF